MESLWCVPFDIRGMNYTSYPLLVFGFHGCDRDTAEEVLSGQSELSPSQNDYDWLGSGIYFWENAPQRALEWATKKKKRHPYVVGAIIQLSRCLNLMDKESSAVLKKAYQTLTSMDIKLPTNTEKFHKLDTLVINTANIYATETNSPYDATRGAFIEGTPIYSGSMIMTDTHIQLCVRNPACIISYFRPKLATLPV